MCFQVKYKEEGKQEMSSNLYSLLPETTETQLAKQLTEMQSEVLQTHKHSQTHIHDIETHTW